MKKMCFAFLTVLFAACNATSSSKAPPGDPVPLNNLSPNDHAINEHAREMFKAGREIFRFDTFGDEAFWGDTLRLHEAIAGEANGGVGDGVTPRAALELGLKVDVDALPGNVREAIEDGTANLDDPKTTLALLKADAVIGVKGFFAENGTLRSMGVQCALCHSAVDDSLAPGIGRRLDGWPNRDLNIGAIVAIAPDLSAFADLLGVREEQVREVLLSWGPGKYDAQLVLDGKAFQPNGESSAVLLPAAFGMAGVNLHTYTGFGSVPYWNAYVAITQMHGKGNFVDIRLNDAEKYPIAARAGLSEVRVDPDEDQLTSKLQALHYYQISIPAPKPPEDFFDAAAAERGKEIFAQKGQCATCHVPPLFTEPGFNAHTAAEIGIDDFQASRSPDEVYRTTPLAGLFTRFKGGFYHDGRFPTLEDVVEHYDDFFGLELTEAEQEDLIEYLKSL